MKEHNPLAEEYRNKFVVASGTYEEVGTVETGPKVKINYRYVADFDCLHDAIHVGLPLTKRDPIVEMHYIDKTGRSWSLDLVEEK